MEASTSFSCNNDPNLCVFPDSFCASWRECRNCSGKFLRLLSDGEPQKLSSFAPSGWDSPPQLAECDSLSTQQLNSVERDLNIADFEFNMTDNQIKEFFADSNGGGRPQSRQDEAVITTYKTQDQPKQLQLVNKPETINQKATQVRFASPLSEHQMEQLRTGGIPEKTRAQTEWGV